MPLHHTGTVELHTPRLTLRRFVIGDADAMYAILRWEWERHR